MIKQDETLLQTLEAHHAMWPNSILSAIEQAVAIMGQKIFEVEWANKHARAAASESKAA